MGSRGEGCEQFLLKAATLLLILSYVSGQTQRIDLIFYIRSME